MIQKPSLLNVVLGLFFLALIGVRVLTSSLHLMLGYRQVGKAIDFDSIIRRFKSCYPIQFYPLYERVLFFQR